MAAHPGRDEHRREASERTRLSGTEPIAARDARRAWWSRTTNTPPISSVSCSRQKGFTVLHASSAEEALYLATQQPLSLITIDLGLPGIDGWEFLLRIREIDALAHVPVVIIATIIDSNMALASGAAAVLQKPISRAELNASLVRLGLAPASFVTRTVLVVDDDPKAVEVIATFLPISEYTVVRAYGGAEAITLAERLRPDVVLLDLMMPDINGFAVVEALQRNTVTARIPIIIVTAKSITADDRSELRNASEMVLEILEKSSFNRVDFLAGVRRATRHTCGKGLGGTHPDHRGQPGQS